MSNTIELAKSFVPKLDECYRLASLTSVLDGAPELAKQGANANELIIPMMSMDGLADYSRNGGYVQGGVTMTNETVKCNFDRGRRFDVDVMDDLETAGLAFGRLSAQFIRDKVVPELDAFRFASYCGISGVTKKEETLADGAATVAALSAAVTAMDDEEVTATGRYLFITPTLLQGINDMDTTKSKKVLEGFEQVIKVPQRRFYTAIKQLSGKTGEEAGGYTKATGAANINFAIVQKDALMAHYLNATFAADDGTASYVRLGKDLEEYSPELSANVEKKTNILGNETVSIDSYQKQGEVSPYYAEKGDPLFEKLQSIIDNDLVLDDLKTDIVEVKLWDAQSSGAFPAVREECYIEVSSYGGDTTGYQIPFNVHYTGVKTKGTFNPTTKAFTAEA